MKLICRALLPRDGLRFEQRANASASLAEILPGSAVRGALRAAFGLALQRREGRSLDSASWDPTTSEVRIVKLLSLRRTPDESFTGRHRLFPVPADARYQGSRLFRLTPRRPVQVDRVHSLGTTEDRAREALWHVEPEEESVALPPDQRGRAPTPPSMWSDADFVAWLRGEYIPLGTGASPAQRSVVQLRIDHSTRSAEPGGSFATGLLEPLFNDRQELALGLQIEVPDAVHPDEFLERPLLLGKRRLAHTAALEPEIFAPPVLFGGASRGLRVIQITPAQFSRGWLPDGLSPSKDAEGPAYVGSIPGLDGEVMLRAALARPLELSTFDMAQRRPRATRRLVAPGSVFYFERLNGAPFQAAERQRLWLSSWGQMQDEGCGLWVAGPWQPDP